MPLANSLRDPADTGPEVTYPLEVRVCEGCFLAQVAEAVDPSVIFHEYPYFSSVSSSWGEHARRFARTAIGELDLTGESLVVEVASNDGYLLRHFHEAGIRVLGVEPSANVAQAAIDAGLSTRVNFLTRAFGEQLSTEGNSADLLVANNVLAHVPDLDDFAAGLAATLKRTGVLTAEFPHLLNLVGGLQFDTIYHEHCSYLSVSALAPLLRRHGLSLFDVETLPTHGGSLRLWIAPDFELFIRQVNDPILGDPACGIPATLYSTIVS